LLGRVLIKRLLRVSALEVRSPPTAAQNRTSNDFAFGPKLTFKEMKEVAQLQPFSFAVASLAVNGTRHTNPASSQKEVGSPTKVAT